MISGVNCFSRAPWPITNQKFWPKLKPGKSIPVADKIAGDIGVLLVSTATKNDADFFKFRSQKLREGQLKTSFFVSKIVAEVPLDEIRMTSLDAGSL